MMRVGILTLYLRGLSLRRCTEQWHGDNISALNPMSDMMAPRYLKLVTIWRFWPLAFISL